MAEYRDPCRETLSRSGTVLSLGPGTAEVALAAASACASCAISGNCLEASGAKTRTVRVPVSGQFAVGDRVEVCMESRHGVIAAVLLFVVPVVLIVLGIFGALALGWEEAPAAISALGLLAVYGAALRLANPRLQKLLPVRVQRLADDGRFPV